MKLWALDFLRCPVSGTHLKLNDPIFQGDHIVEGKLVSEEGLSYPIARGVPRLITGYLNKDEKLTAEAFGDEWQIFNRSTGYMASEELFFNFLRGISPADLKNKIVLDAGCGNGRWDKVVSNFKPDKVIALDISNSVNSCFDNTRNIDNIVVVQGSICQPPLAKEIFDIIFSIGVVDHTPEPFVSLSVLKSLLKMQGKLAFWVYAYEGNEGYLKIAEPLRRVSTKMPKGLLRLLSQILSAFVLIHIHGINKYFGLRKDKTQRLPMARYFSFLRKCKYNDIVNVVYDQLAPELAHYIRKDELRGWLTDLDLKIGSLVFRNNNSYSVVTERV